LDSEFHAHSASRICLDRRDLLRCALGGGCALAAGTQLVGPRLVAGQDAMPNVALEGVAAESDRYVAPARHWEARENKRVLCTLCPRECEVADLERGGCGVRENREGKYVTLVYNRPCSLAIDPIEKKPLFHFLPGTKALSTATAGCNIWCRFCQNWEISQKRPEQVRSVYMTPAEMIDRARQTGSTSIAFTYNEPVVFYEWMYDIAEAGKKSGVRTVMISNGYIQREPMRELAKVLSGVKIDLKAFTEKFYDELCDGKLKPVLDTLIELKSLGMWFEIVVLIIPTLNDSKKECAEMCQWIVKNLGPDVPIHFSRFHATYMIKNLPETPVTVLERNCKIAAEAGLHYAYMGNVRGAKWENTRCHNCGKQIIDRYGYLARSRVGRDGKCPECKTAIPGVWS
jgi:pyruvate formate lyase activating enzyme